MALSGTERVVRYLVTPDTGPALVEKIVAEHGTGNLPLDPYLLTAMYRKEISAPTPTKDKYQTLASMLATWMAADFEAKFARLSAAGRLSTLLLATQKQAHSWGSYVPVSIAELRDKLPSVVEKVRRGDLTRFVNLISTGHCYGVCVKCGATPSLSLLTPGVRVPPMQISFTVDSAARPHATKLLQGLNFPDTFCHVLGICTNGCSTACSNCHKQVSPMYDHEWITALREDQMCTHCASKQLINVKRPKFTRQDQRRLRRLIIT